MTQQADLLENSEAANSAGDAGAGLPEKERLVSKIASLLSEADALEGEIQQRRQLLKVARAETELAETPDIKDLDQVGEMQTALTGAELRLETVNDAVDAARRRLSEIADAERRARKRSALVAIAELAQLRTAMADELSAAFSKIEAAISQLRQIERSIGEQGRIAGIIVAGSLKDGRRLRRGLVGELAKVAPLFSQTVELPRMHRAAGFSEYLAALHVASIENLIAEHDAVSASDQIEKAA